MSGQLKTIFRVFAVVCGVLAATGSVGANPSLCVVVQEGCYVPGSMVYVTLELGQGEPVIVGGQFSIQYDPAILDFVDMSPGGTCAPDSPFVMELYESVDEVSGEIFYSVIIDIAGEPGTSGPATMACLSFLVLEGANSEVCLADDPMSNVLVDDNGSTVAIDNTEDCPVDGMPPSVSCDEVDMSATCVCSTGVPDCSMWDDDCNVGQCLQPPARCEPVPANEGGPCDDGNPCTTVDVCIDGVCIGSGCANQSVCIVAEEGCLAFEGAQLRLELGEGEPVIVAGEFWIEYDPQVLDFVDISPGAACDPDSPFRLEIFQDADEVSGEILYAVGVDFVQDGIGTQGPATLACLSFAFTGDWESEVCLVTGGDSAPTMLIDEFGAPVLIYNAEVCPADAPPPILCCDEVLMDEDCTCVPGTADCSALDTDCLEGVCNEQTGRCRTVRINQGGPCDDGDPCTKNDRCIGGICKGSGCTNPSLCIVDEGCVGPGLPNRIRVRLGETDRVVTGGQFSIVYDPTALDLVDISPGAACDPRSPFDLEIFERVDDEIGEAFYAVSLYPGGGGTSGPATMACLTFVALQSNPGEVCLFNGLNPFNTVLVSESGTAVGIYNGEDCPLYGYPPSFISCTEICTIPTISEWGLVVMTLLLLVTAKIRFGHVDRCPVRSA